MNSLPLFPETSYPVPEKKIDRRYPKQPCCGAISENRTQRREPFRGKGAPGDPGRAVMGSLLQEQFRHTGSLEPTWSRGCLNWFESSHDTISPRGWLPVLKEEGILGEESDALRWRWGYVASDLCV